MTYGLPESVTIRGIDYRIRSDFRVMMDIFEVLNDAEIQDRERGYLAICFFYEDVESIPAEFYQEAVEKLYWFIRGGSDDNGKPSRRLVDWEQDYPLIIAPVNRIVGKEVRSMEHFHWWSFLSAYMEIGECTFSQVLSIRSSLADGKKLSKQDNEWYKRNREIVDLHTKYTDAETDLLAKWGGG